MANRNPAQPNPTNWAILVQCRLASERFPEKVLAPVYWENGKAYRLIDTIYYSLQNLRHYLPQWVTAPQGRTLNGHSRLPVYFIIPDNEPKLARALDKAGFPYVQGHPENVLARYQKAARSLDAGTIIRLTADNPFYDLKILSDLITGILENPDLDYLAFMGLFLGTAGEAFRAGALERLTTEFRGDMSLADYEHVSLYIKKNPNKFRLEKRTSRYADDISQAMRDAVRLTCDYPSDLDLLQAVAATVPNPLDVTNQDVLDLAESRPWLFQNNRLEIRRRFC